MRGRWIAVLGIAVIAIATFVISQNERFTKGAVSKQTEDSVSGKTSSPVSGSNKLVATTQSASNLVGDGRISYGRLIAEEFKEADHAYAQLIQAFYSRREYDVEYEDALIQAYALIPDDFLVNYLLLERCLADMSSSLCGLPFVDTLLQSSRLSFKALVGIADFYERNGDSRGADEALLWATKLERVHSHYPAVMDSLGALLPTSSEKNNLYQLMLVNEVAVNMGLIDGFYRRFEALCNTATPDSTRASQCSTLAERMLEPGGILVDRRVGRAFYARYSTAPPKETMEVLAKFDRQKLLENEVIRQLTTEQQALMGGDFSTWRDIPMPPGFWQNLSTLYGEEGELAALQFWNQVIAESRKPLD